MRSRESASAFQSSFSKELGIPFQGIPASETPAEVKEDTEAARLPLRPETREAFMKALDGLRAAGATVVFDDSILADNFAVTVARVGTVPYIREGTEKFLAEFGPAQYHSPDEYQKAVGSPLPATIIGGVNPNAPERIGTPVVQAVFENDPQARGQRARPPAKSARRLQRNTGSAASGRSTSIPRRRCLRPMRPCRRTARSAKVRTAPLDGST